LIEQKKTIFAVSNVRNVLSDLGAIWCFLALILTGCSSNISLTPAPIDIGPEEKAITAGEKLIVKNNRAALHVHLADLSEQEFGQIVTSGMNYPIARLVHPSVCKVDNEGCSELQYAGISLDNTTVEGIYRADWDQIQGVHEFSVVRIHAERNLKNIRLIWKGSKK